MASYSLATWKCMETVANHWVSCLGGSLRNLSLPSQENVDKFIWWGYSRKKWKWATMVSYLSHISNVFKLKGIDASAFHSFKTKNMLRGVRNLDSIKIELPPKRKVFSLPLLKLLGHAVATSDWTIDSKSVFWTACCILFFGSLRIGEILSSNQNCFDPLTTLLWGDVVFNQDFVRIYIRFPKIFSPGGISIDLFEISDKNLCPVACLKKLKALKGLAQKKASLPVFCFKSGIFLTPATFNESLRNLLFQFLGEDSKCFTSHSFRAAIPAALADAPFLASKECIMGWGRWDSGAYMKYTRLKANKRRETFKVICSLFNI
jgi:hypothetical protein